MQEFTFCWGEANSFPIHADFVTQRIDADGTDCDDGGGALCQGRASSTTQGVYVRQQLGGKERFTHIIIGAEFQSAYLVLHLVAVGHDQDQGIVLMPHVPTHGHCVYQSPPLKAFVIHRWG